ncbi:AAA family ATPase [Lentzea sp. NPDC058450]|uniref:AAA family ATPase n=1 Tax=Lentzea sp. NPDC058450 TaxID=3346505 RepID=UPI003655B51A
MTANPFSSMAVTHAPEVDGPRVETDPIRVAKAHLDAYLAAPRTGNVIVVVGDYGTGKSRLAAELLQHVDARCRRFYLEANPNGLAGLYRAFTDALRQEDVLEPVNEVYAEIVAEELHATGILSPQQIQLLREGALDPQHGARNVSLPLSSLHGRTEARLTEITRHPMLSKALALLLREDDEKNRLKNAVWSWLRGGPPDQMLVERGIHQRLDSNDAALAAMSGFVRLHARDDRQLLMVVDELHKLVAAGPDDAGMTAFKSLLQQAGSAGAFLVLAGLPELESELRPDVRQRITHRIRMSGFGTDQVCEYIEEALGDARDNPFPRDVVGYLVGIADGVPRKIIQLCSELYRRWSTDGTPITDDLVREAAKSARLSSVDDVEAATARLLDAEGLTYLKQYFVGRTVDTRVDFWVSFPDGSAGCAVVLTESVLNFRDAERLTSKVLALRQIELGCRVLLVVNGGLAAEPADRLVGVLSRPPLVYQRLAYADHMTALLRAIRSEVSAETGHEPIEKIYQALEQITRQQASIHGFVERVAERLDQVRSTSDASLETMAARLDEIAGELHRMRDGEPALGEPALRLPPHVDQEFVKAIDQLTEVLDIRAVLADEFTGDRPSRLLLHLRKGLEPAAVAILLHEIVTRFRAEVGAWYREASAVSPVPVAAYDRLDEICHAFDRVTEQVPIARLEELAGGRKPELVRTFYTLGVNVRHGFH